MATTSEVKTGLVKISGTIDNARDVFQRSKARIEAMRAELANIPGT